MSTIHRKAGSNFVIFILFFCGSLIEAMLDRNWNLAALFLMLAFLFLYADYKRA